MKVYTTGEVAKLLGLPRRTVCRYCAVGRIPAAQHPVSKVRKIEHEHLIRFMKDNGLDTSQLTPPAKVLIVDDEPSVTKAIASTLDETGWRISLDSASNGYDALVRIGADTPDLLILDVIMPKMNGIEVLRSLKQGENTKNINILVLTGYPDQIEEMMRLGADAALSKPFRGAQLIEAVGKLLPELGSLRDRRPNRGGMMK